MISFVVCFNSDWHRGTVLVFCCRLNWLLPLVPPPLPPIIESENGLTASLSLSASLLCVDVEICLYLVREGRGRMEPNNTTAKDFAIRLLFFVSL